MSMAKQIFDSAFAMPRDKRSDAYKDGVLRTLRMRLGEFDLAPGYIPKQYTLGTAECDAYFAGTDEGHRLASEYIEELAMAYSPSKDDPTLSQQMAAAGFTRRKTDLSCEDCGAELSSVLQVQMHECTWERTAATLEAGTRPALPADPLEKLTRLTEEMGLYPWQEGESVPTPDRAFLEQNIFNFAGWLTTRPGVMPVGSTSNAAPVAEAVSEYIKTYPERFSRPALPAEPLSDKRKDYLRRLIAGVRRQIDQDPETIKAREECGDELIIGTWVDASLLCLVVEKDVLHLPADSIAKDQS